jgi:Ubiquitin family
MIFCFASETRIKYYSNLPTPSQRCFWCGKTDNTEQKWKSGNEAFSPYNPHEISIPDNITSTLSYQSFVMNLSKAAKALSPPTPPNYKRQRNVGERFIRLPDRLIQICGTYDTLTIAELKDKIDVQTNIEWDDYDLVFAKTVLENDKCFECYKILSGHLITLRLREVIKV